MKLQTSITNSFQRWGNRYTSVLKWMAASKTGHAALVTGIVFVTAIASPAAPTITYVGHQVDIEADADTPTEGWRNPTPAKPLDIDGDHILGTDGWWLANHKSAPSYAWIKQTAPNGNGGNWGKWDNPSDPSGPDTFGAVILHGPGNSLDAFQLVIHGDAPNGKTLRLGVLYGVAGSGTNTFTLTQTVGGSREAVTSPPIDFDGTALDVAFFDITGAKEGDTFIVNSKGVKGGPHVAGITFDTALTAEVKETVEPEGVVRTRYHAPFELCHVFTDNAVLQRNVVLPVWGWADPGTVVTVAFAGQKVQATANDNGRWTANLQPLKSSDVPRELVASTKEKTITRKNILVGDVWLCAGQSNMLMNFNWAPKIPCDLPGLVKPAEWPGIRHFLVDGSAEYPQIRLPEPKKGETQWSVCNEQSYKEFTAAGLFFACTVSKEVGVPIGLINVAEGNTRIGSWVSSESIDLVKEHVPGSSFRAVYSPTPCTLFNARIAPLAGLPIKGMLWYQGEANGGEGESYFWKMKALILGWREAWGRDDIPFYYVQLPSYTGGGAGWAPTREAQRKALTIPHTGMAVLTDAGDNEAEWPGNLHPRNKYTVGQRLALWALAKDYGKTDLVYSGPLFKSADFKGGKAVVSFDHVGSGLMAAKKENPTSIEPPEPVAEVVGFELHGAADGAGTPAWHPARAAIEGDAVVVSSPEVKQPTAVRYLYTMNTDHGTLYNKEGLPASPFTTGE